MDKIFLTLGYGCGAMMKQDAPYEMTECMLRIGQTLIANPDLCDLFFKEYNKLLSPTKES